MDTIHNSLRAKANKRLHSIAGGNEYVRIAVLIADFFILNIIILVWMLFFKETIPPFVDGATKISIIVANFALIIAEYFFHTIIDRRLLTFREVMGNVLKLTLCQALIMGLTMRFLSKDGGLFFFMVIFGVVEFSAVLVSRFVQLGFLKYLRAHGRNSRTVLLVGNDPILGTLYERFTYSPSGGYRVKGYYADEPMKEDYEGLDYLGTIDDLLEKLARWDEDILEEPNVQELFCCLSHDEEDTIKRIMCSCDHNVIHFFYVPRTFADPGMSLTPIRYGNYVYYSRHNSPLYTPMNRFLKRTFDICFSFLICVFIVVPMTIIVGIIIKLQSPGPIFFKQDRTGLDGKTFSCYKFRSMHVNKEADNLQATEHDPRKFPFGNFMRKTNIDELPQFFNVLIGDMSVVGPRPHMLHHTEMYGKLIDSYMVRLFCRPGITGWAQITGFRGETKELWQMEGRVERDIWYVEHWSLKLDILIILKTIKSLFVHDEKAY